MKNFSDLDLFDVVSRIRRQTIILHLMFLHLFITFGCSSEQSTSSTNATVTDGEYYRSDYPFLFTLSADQSEVQRFTCPKDKPPTLETCKYFPETAEYSLFKKKLINHLGGSMKDSVKNDSDLKRIRKNLFVLEGKIEEYETNVKLATAEKQLLEGNLAAIEKEIQKIESISDWQVNESLKNSHKYYLLKTGSLSNQIYKIRKEIEANKASLVQPLKEHVNETTDYEKRAELVTKIYKKAIEEVDRFLKDIVGSSVTLPSQVLSKQDQLIASHLNKAFYDSTKALLVYRVSSLSGSSNEYRSNNILRFENFDWKRQSDETSIESPIVFRYHRFKVSFSGVNFKDVTMTHNGKNLQQFDKKRVYDESWSRSLIIHYFRISENEYVEVSTRSNLKNDPLQN